MAEQYVGKTAEFKDGDRRIIFAGENEIGVFRHEGAFYAYSNFCLHQGGPACEGLTIAKVEEKLRPDKRKRRSKFWIAPPRFAATTPTFGCDSANFTWHSFSSPIHSRNPTS